MYSCPILKKQERLLFHIICCNRQGDTERNSIGKRNFTSYIIFNRDGVVTTDNEGRITMLNKAGQRITGWSEDEAKGSI